MSQIAHLNSLIYIGFLLIARSVTLIGGGSLKMAKHVTLDDDSKSVNVTEPAFLPY